MYFSIHSQSKISLAVDLATDPFAILQKSLDHNYRIFVNISFQISIEWDYSLNHCCSYSKILQIPIKQI